MKIKLLINKFILSLKRVNAQFRKEIDSFLHDKISIVILFVLPLFIIVLIGSGAFSITEIAGSPIVYMLDLDQTEYSMAFINTYKNSTEFDMEIYDNHKHPELVTLENCQLKIMTNELDAYVIIPVNFTQNLLQNRSSYINITIDFDSETGAFVQSYFQNGNLIFQSNFQVFDQEIVFIPEFRPNAEFSFIEVTLPLLIPLLLFVCANLISSQSIVGDEPLKRLLLTPARKTEIILAKSIAYSLLGVFMAFVSIFVLDVIFQVQFHSFFDTFLIAACIPWFGVSYGIFFSAITTSKLQAAQLSLFSFIFQFVIVSFIRIHPLVNFLPVEIVRNLFTILAFRGVELQTLSWDLVKIVFHNMIVVFLSIFVFRLKKVSI